ncbi:ABC transporter ATP-binding protein [Occultella kanbiaonis]|uniref:ABC transporter ATP-binding protein n=1 Tax=Occultella kanbiaonis TaxID=2675754 RepID=UPI0013D3B257|nr:ABC transporter ATP-binding protein [Occultella kanbiaonis]
MTDAESQRPLLRVKDLRVTFDLPTGPLQAVREVSFDLRPGQILGVVGESGSGKSVTSRAIMRMLRRPGRISAGSIELEGDDILRMSPVQIREVRGTRVAMIFQDPQAALNPVVRVKHQVMEALLVHGSPRAAAESRAIDLLRKVGIPDPVNAAEKYPHQFSGGMRQRVVIAIALANEPGVLIADEPTTALDVTIQAQILSLLRSLRDELKIAILFITHDMGVVAELCDDVVVMYQGEIVESGNVRDVLSRPQHPYTVRLMDAVPRMDAPLRNDAPVHDEPPVLEVRNLRTNVNSRRTSLFRRPTPFYAVDDVSLHVNAGETLALVGESGCGKSTLSRTIVGISEAESGQILIDGDRRAVTGPEHIDQVRAVQYVFQDPFSSLNPRRTAGQSLEEALKCAGCPPRDLRRRSIELLERVSLGEEHLDRYPWAFSGGQRQRIGIARALASDPRMLILDEPVSALDVSIQAQILQLLRHLQEEYGMAYLFISHDLAVVREISHRVAVMFKGKIVEQGTTGSIFDHPEHPYTRTLLAATPDLDSAFA